jgi:hypothetical protein
MRHASVRGSYCYMMAMMNFQHLVDVSFLSAVYEINAYPVP